MEQRGTHSGGPAHDAPETLVVVNPASASGRTARRWEAIERQLRAHGLRTRAQLTSAPGDATRIVREFVQGGGRDIVVLGGDGTVNEVTGGLVGEGGDAVLATGVTLALVHQGTGGDATRGLGIPRTGEQAVSVAATGRPHRVDIGIATFADEHGVEVTRAFFNHANVGAGSDVCAMVEGRLKRLGNAAAFGVASIAVLLRNRRRTMRVTADGEGAEHDLVDVTVCNGRYMGGGMFVAPGAALDDGELDLVLIAAAPRRRLLASFPQIYRGTHLDNPIVTTRRAREIAVDGTRERYGVVLDGELVGFTPARFRLLPGAVSVRVPPAGY